MGTNDRHADKISLGRGRFAGGRQKKREREKKMKAAATGFYPSGFVNESCPPSLIKRLGHLGYPCVISNPVLVFRGCFPLCACCLVLKMQRYWYNAKT